VSDLQNEPKTWRDTIGYYSAGTAVLSAVIGVVVKWAWSHYQVHLPFWVGLIGWPSLALWVVAFAMSVVGFVVSPRKLLPAVGWVFVVAYLSLFELDGWVRWISVPAGLLFLAAPWIVMAWLKWKRSG